MNEDPLKWEWIHEGFMQRSKVPWGWLVRCYENVFHPDKVTYSDQYGTGFDYRIFVCFVFDPFHWWNTEADHADKRTP